MNYIILNRYRKSDYCTRGVLIIPDVGNFQTLELPDLNNERGKSSIPTGVYPIGFNNVLTPLTKKYRKKYEFFKYHIHIKNVPNRDNIYIHIGNSPKDINGCIAIGRYGNSFSILESTTAYEVFYKYFNSGMYQYLIINEV